MSNSSLLAAAICFLWLATVACHRNFMSATSDAQVNVLGQELKLCSSKPLTGYDRSGYCHTMDHDEGTHVICATVTATFLNFTKSRQNDLSTPRNGFPGLIPNDNWCLCALRWKEAFDASVAPPVVLEATNRKAFDYVTLEDLKSPKPQ
eukprot:c51_g1_i1.p1 GENE.c51_g1_i1~~c51_g1_i1.p1  ORF type:complete len:149 (-),score=33.26 c51_g1_i1:119-565(-)